MLYSVGVGPGVSQGRGREFADKVARVLTDPRGWRKYGYDFRQVSVGKGDLHIHLESAEDAAALCGVPGFSCERSRNDIVINLENWLGGSKSELPLDRYQNYVISHEVGHALGLEHQRCPAEECARRGMTSCPASVMQQMTRGPAHVSPCVESDWPLDPDWRIDDPRPRPRRGFVIVLLLLILVIAALAIPILIHCMGSYSGIRNGVHHRSRS